MNIIDHLPNPSHPESTRVPTVFPVEIAGEQSPIPKLLRIAQLGLRNSLVGLRN